MYSEVKNHAINYGVVVGGLSFDLDKMMEQKDASVKGLTSGIEGLFKKNKVHITSDHSWPPNSANI